MNATTPHPTTPPAELPPTPDVTVADVMHSGVIFCERQASAEELAKAMITHGVHSVAVLGHTQNARHDPTVWGIVSDVDLLAGVVDPDAPATAGDLARHPVITIRVTRPIREAAQTIATYRVNHLVVIDGEKQSPVGFISPLDIARAFLPDLAGTTDSSPSTSTSKRTPACMRTS
jgi:CBS domain-containing protein